MISLIKVYIAIETSLNGDEYIKGVFSSEFKAYKFIEKFGNWNDYCIKVYLLNDTTNKFLRVITF